MSSKWIEVFDLALMPRFRNEKFYINEFITPKAFMITEVANRLRADNEVQHVWNMFKWVVEEIRYPWRSGLPSILMLVADMHMLFRHPFKPRFSLCIVDYWKFPYETIRDRVGDCEDTTFLLCSMLRSCKYNAYAVLGRVIIDNVPYGHAWVEYIHPQYGPVILETTFESLGEFRDFDDYIRWERRFRDMYKAELKFNERETYAFSEAVLAKISSRLRVVSFRL